LWSTCFINKPLILMAYNGLHMACGGSEALSCPPKLKLATKRKPCV
jgi:hypothetical protein